MNLAVISHNPVKTKDELTKELSRYIYEDDNDAESDDLSYSDYKKIVLQFRDGRRFIFYHGFPGDNPALWIYDDQGQYLLELFESDKPKLDQLSQSNYVKEIINWYLNITDNWCDYQHPVFDYYTEFN